MDFLSKDIKPCKKEAEDLADAILEVLQKDAALKDAMLRAPTYTGQYSREDFYAKELQDWYNAAEELYKVIKG